MELKKKKNPVTINTEEVHANHKTKVLWYCSRNRRKCGRKAESSLMVG